MDLDAITTASLSDVGRTRSENQDACGEFRNAQGERLFVVADGMGGHRGGATASRICVETLGRGFTESTGDANERLRRGIEQANERIYATAESDAELRGMGTTAVVLLFTERRGAYLGWVGDSRAYRLRAGALERLTDDHSLVSEWVRAGVLTREEAEVHPRKNELTRALGVDRNVRVEVAPIGLEPGDRLLLCSDGLCGVVPETDIASVLGRAAPEQAAVELVDRAIALGGPDNITLQIAVLPGGELTSPVSEHRPRSSRLAIRPVLAAIALLAFVVAGLAVYAGFRSGGGG